MKIEVIEEHNEIVDLIKEAFDINFDELVFSKKWNIKKNKFSVDVFKTKFWHKKCLGIVLCKSESSGYTKKRKCTICFGQS